MPKSRGRKKSKTKSATKGARSSAPLLVRWPSGRDAEKMRSAVHMLAEQSAELFPGLIEDLNEILKRTYPPQLLAALSSYGLQSFIDQQGNTTNPFATHEFSQHHVELLQALALRLPISGWGTHPLLPDVVTSAVELVSRAGSAFRFRRVKELEAAPREKHLQLSLQERLRGATQVIRNWGSFGQVVEHSRQLYGRLNGRLLAGGFMSATSIVDAFAFCMGEVERKSNERIEMLAAVNRQKGVKAKIAKYYELNPHLKGTPDELIRALPASAPEQTAMALILGHSDLALTDHFSFSAGDISAAIGVSEELLRRTMDALAILPGELAGQSAEHVFLANPVWMRPLMKMEEDIYFCVLPQAFFSHVHRIFRKLCEDRGFATQLAHARSEYLEERLQSLLSHALPVATIHPNVKWRHGVHEGEHDAVAVIDHTVIIVEAKSGVISEPALRGAPDRARRHVRELILDPSSQSLRLEKLIEEGKAGDSTASSILHGLNIDPSTITRVLRLTVTLEDFAPIASAEKELKALGWIDASHPLAPAMTLADLEVVLEILDGPVPFLHYLAGRGRLQKKFETEADELDWLGFYLETGFAFRAAEPEIDALLLTGMSKPIDRYYSAKDAGIEVQRPRARRAPLWSTCLKELERRSFPGWLDIALALLGSASPSEQFKFQRSFEKTRRRVPAVWRKEGHQCAGIVVPPGVDARAVVFFAYPPQLHDLRRERANQLAATALEGPRVSEVAVFGFNTANGETAPFVFVTTYRRDREPPRSTDQSA